MEKLTLGKSEIKITPIVMGTWQAGKSMWSGIDDSESLKAIRAAFEAGITTFDTAEEYGKGHSEKILGRVLSDVRDRVVIATKVSPSHLTYDQVIEACDRSLKNLGTDYIDLYQIHWPAGSWRTKPVSIEETMAAMINLKQKGKIRAIGVSNFSRLQLEEAAAYARIESVQSPYSLFWNKIEKDPAPYCIKNEITILGYSSLAQGILTGKFGAGHRFAKKDHRSRNRLFKPENFERVQRSLVMLRAVSERLGATMSQLALAWVFAKPGFCAIAGARNAQQVVENAKAGCIHLTAKDLAEIDSIGRIVTDHLDDNPVMWDF